MIGLEGQTEVCACCIVFQPTNGDTLRNKDDHLNAPTSSTLMKTAICATAVLLPGAMQDSDIQLDWCVDKNITDIAEWTAHQDYNSDHTDTTWTKLRSS